MKAQTRTQTLTLTLAALALVTTVSTLAQAETIRCTFTEPFVTTVFDSTKQTLTVITPDDKASHKVIRNVSLQINGPASFSLIGADKKEIQALNLNNQGSDGMSDTVYPFEVKFNALHGNNIGGCESSKLKATQSSN